MTRYFDENKMCYVTETEDGDIIAQTELDSSNCDSIAQAKYLVKKYRKEEEQLERNIKKLKEKYSPNNFPEIWI